jgi:hypothetical protein
MTAGGDAIVKPASPRERFFGALTPELRRQVLALPDVLRAHSDRFIVFTARKAVCVADALDLLGYWESTGDFCSTRALDGGDRDAFAGRDVLIVDDVAASGRMIKLTAGWVRERGAQDVACFALATDGEPEEWAPRLDVRFVGPYLASDLSQNLVHTKSLVEAFRALPRPYNVDWPVYRLQTPLQLEKLLDAGWQTAGVTPGTGAAPISLEPGMPLLADLALLLPAWFTDLLTSMNLAKVRLYPVRNPARGGTQFFAVPIVTTAPMSHSETIRTADAFADLVGSERFSTNSTRETYRALQYLLGEFLIQVAFCAADIESPPPDERTPYHLFLEPTRSLVRRGQLAARGFVRRSLDGRLTGPVRPVRVAVAADLWRDRVCMAASESFLANVFLDNYMQSREYDLRSRLRATSDETERGGIVEKLVSLDRSRDVASLSFDELRTQLGGHLAENGFRSPVDVDRVVNEFLDTTIDSGEVVPEIQREGATVLRRFRAGEIIAFQAAEQALFERMLHAYSDSVESRLFSQDLLQKLMVGFASFLIATKRLEDLRLSGVAEGDVDRLKRRYHLRGAVLADVESEFVAPPGVPRSIQILEAREVVAPVGRDNKNYRLASEPRLTPNVTDEFFGSTYGKVMAAVMSLKGDDGKSLLDEDAFARLVTLSDPVEQVLALGADIKIASNFLGTHTFASASQLRQSKGLFGAINQGLAKARWCLSDRSRRVLSEVERRLRAEESPVLDNARSVLAALVPADRDSELQAILEREAGWFRDSYYWALALEQLLPNEVSEAARIRRLRSSLRNKALVELNAHVRRRPGGARAQMVDALTRVSGDAAPAEISSDVVEAVSRELQDEAAELIDRCYDIDAAGATKPPPRTGIATCLLLQQPSGRVPNLGKRKGLRTPAYAIRSHPDSPLRRFNVCFRATSTFTVLERGDEILEVIADSGGDAVFIDTMPLRFHSHVEEATLRPSQDFLELMRHVVDYGAGHGKFVVVCEQASTSPVAREIAANRSESIDVVVAGATWEISVYKRSQEGAREVQPPRPTRHRANQDERKLEIINFGGGVIVNQGGDNIHRGDNISHGPVGAQGAGASASGNTFVQDAPRVLSELGRLQTALMHTSAGATEIDHALVDQARGALEADDESQFVATVKRFGPAVRRAVRDLGLDLLAGWMERHGLPPGTS